MLCCVRSCVALMAPHLAPQEVDHISRLAQNRRKFDTPWKIHEIIAKQRQRKGIEVPCVAVIRRALAGVTHRRGRSETRGRKRKLSRTNTKSLNEARQKLINQADGEYEVTCADVIKKARVPTVHPTTAARSFRKDDYNIAARRPREKPYRDNDTKKEREAARRRLGDGIMGGTLRLNLKWS